MLKRTIGRLLLTSLVITGLAGTYNDATLSQGERKSVLHLLKDSRSSVVSCVDGLSAAQLNYKSPGNHASVRESLYHIAYSEKKLWAILEASLKSQANPEMRLQMKFTDESFLLQLQDSPDKILTGEETDTKKPVYTSVTRAMTAFKTERADHITYMRSTTEDLRNHVVKMPFGWIDCYQLCLFIAAHSNYHVEQINEWKNSPGFPAK